MEKTELILSALENLWLLWAAVGFVVLLKAGASLRLYLKVRRSGITEIDLMSGIDFEQRLYFLFRNLGYKSELTAEGADFGADLIIERNGIRTVVQAKRLAKPVGVSAIQQAVAAKGLYDCETAMVVTNSHFTTPAIRLAETNEVTLWERSDLIRALSKRPRAPANHSPIEPLEAEEPFFD